MKVTAALAFWNELPADLEACVRGVASIADRIVAVDGAYMRYPGATVLSDEDQIAAIRMTAEMFGLEYAIHRPDILWAGQVEKRTFLLREAAKGSDWIVVVDTDHVIHTDRKEVRAALAEMPAKVNTIGVDFWTPLNEDRDLALSIATNWHLTLAGKTVKMAHIFRALADLTVEKKHWIYTGLIGTSRIEMRYGGKADVNIGVPYVVEHRSLFRTEQQIRDGRAFCNDREMVVARTGQEDHVPGLPDPVWDFETLTYSQRRGMMASDITELDLPRAQAEAEEREPATKPPKDQPLRVPTFGEAVRAIASGYPRTFVRITGTSLTPAIRPEEIVLVDSTAEPKVGDLVLARLRLKTAIFKLVAVREDGRFQLASGHGFGQGYVRTIAGVVAWHGAKEDDFERTPAPKAVARRKKTAVATAPRRRGRSPRSRSTDW